MSNNYKSYKKQYVGVDCTVFGYEEGELQLLLYPRGFEPALGRWSLLGAFVGEDESLEEAAGRVLLETTGLKDIMLEQVAAFSNPGRDPGGRVIIVAFVALIRIDKYDKDLVREKGAHWWPVSKLPALIFDHQEIVSKALELLQWKASFDLVGRELLPDKFTLMKLRKLYEAIFQKELDKGNFRKKVLSLGVLERLNSKNTTESKRGAFNYRFIKNAETKFDRIVKFP